MSMTRLCAFFFLTAVLVAFSAQAIVGDLGSDQPIEISADQLEVLQSNQKAVFVGNVVAVQGDVTMRSARMTVHYRDANNRGGSMGAVSKIEVDDNVHLTTPQESAKAAKAIYDVDKEQIVMLGNVLLTRGKNVLKGDRLDYNLRTQKSVLTSVPSGNSQGGVSSGRVKGVFVPNQ